MNLKLKLSIHHCLSKRLLTSVCVIFLSSGSRSLSSLCWVSWQKGRSASLDVDLSKTALSKSEGGCEVSEESETLS